MLWDVTGPHLGKEEVYDVLLILNNSGYHLEDELVQGKKQKQEDQLGEYSCSLGKKCWWTRVALSPTTRMRFAMEFEIYLEVEQTDLADGSDKESNSYQPIFFQNSIIITP